MLVLIWAWKRNLLCAVVWLAVGPHIQRVPYSSRPSEYKPLDGSEVSSVVLDGEILTFNSREKAVEPFGFVQVLVAEMGSSYEPFLFASVTMRLSIGAVQQIARDQRSGKDLDFDQHFLIKFFDILHLNGEWYAVMVSNRTLHTT
jgi:ATP-dependent DNA ligase